MVMFLLLTMMIRVTSGNKRQQLSLVLVVYPDRSGQVFSSPYTSSANGPFHETKWRNQLKALPIVLIWLRANWWHFLANCGLVCWPEVDNKSQNFAIRLFCDTNLSSRKEKDKSGENVAWVKLWAGVTPGRVTRVHETYRMWGSGEEIWSGSAINLVEFQQINSRTDQQYEVLMEIWGASNWFQGCFRKFLRLFWIIVDWSV